MAAHLPLASDEDEIHVRQPRDSKVLKEAAERQHHLATLSPSRRTPELHQATKRGRSGTRVRDLEEVIPADGGKMADETVVWKEEAEKPPFTSPGAVQPSLSKLENQLDKYKIAVYDVEHGMGRRLAELMGMKVEEEGGGIKSGQGGKAEEMVRRGQEEVRSRLEELTREMRLLREEVMLERVAKGGSNCRHEEGAEHGQLEKRREGTMTRKKGKRGKTGLGGNFAQALAEIDPGDWEMISKYLAWLLDVVFTGIVAKVRDGSGLEGAFL